MTDRVIIEIDDAQAQRWFGQVIARGLDMRGLMDQIGENLLVSTQERFRTGRGPDGQPWAKLKNGSGRTPLLDTGTMRDQIEPQPIQDGVELVANAKQARWHQEGTDPYVILPRDKKALAWPGGPGPRRKVNHPGLPARPFMGLSAEDEQTIDALVAEWLEIGE